MTQKEYRALYMQASNSLPNLTHRALNKMQEVYRQAAAQVADKLKALAGQNIATETILSMQSLQIQLEASAKMVEDALKKVVPTAVQLGQDKFNKINREYLLDISQYTNGLITQTGIRAMITAVNNDVMMSIVSRIYQDGYSFSERVWRAGKEFQDNIKNIISAGIAQNRDILDIARDLNAYVRTDKLTLIKRYGDLLKGTKEFAKRIRKNIYFPSLMLIRSELYASLMDNAKLTGQYNPGCSGLWDWVRTGLTDWNCLCPEHADNGPYTLDKIPAYPHSLCLCKLVPRLRNQTDFINDLKTWGQGNSVDYLDKWYQNIYPNIHTNVKIWEAA